MLIESRNNNFSFKQIKLATKEMIEAKKCLQQIISEPYNAKHNYKLFNTFEEHLNKEVENKNYVFQLARKKFATSLYVKFFEILETIKKDDKSLENFIDYLNNFCEKFNPKNSDKECNISEEFNVSSAKGLVHYLYTNLGIPKEEFLKICQKTPILQTLTYEAVKLNIKNTSKKLGFNKVEFINIFRRNPNIIMLSENQVSKITDNITKTLNVENNETLRNLIEYNPMILTFNNLEKSINDIAEFLDVDTEIVKTIIKSTPKLATMPIDFIKRNFYAMKDFLKVERDEMVEIALMSPITISKNANTAEKRYQQLADTLGISLNKFIERANKLHSPAIYRTTTESLEKKVEFISSKLNLTREESLEFINSNLTILSYRYNSIVEKHEENFNLLNKELDIDYETYISMLKNNSWLIGHKSEFIKENIEELYKYFNITKEELKELILKNPRIITLCIELIDKNITKGAEVLNIKKEEYKEMCFNKPKLITQELLFNKNDIHYIANALEMSIEKFVELCKKDPNIWLRTTTSFYEAQKDIKNMVLPDINTIEKSANIDIEKDSTLLSKGIEYLSAKGNILAETISKFIK